VERGAERAHSLAIDLADGWLWFVSSAQTSARSTSIQRDVPVQPRWPIAPRGPVPRRVPSDEPSGLRVSHPSARVLPGAPSLRANAHATSSGTIEASPDRASSQAWPIAATSGATENRPAWPAPPPIAQALSSFTAPRTSSRRAALRPVGANARPSIRTRVTSGSSPSRKKEDCRPSGSRTRASASFEMGAPPAASRTSPSATNPSSLYTARAPGAASSGAAQTASAASLFPATNAARSDPSGGRSAGGRNAALATGSAAAR
jgi:hypothetical protein